MDLYKMASDGLTHALNQPDLDTELIRYCRQHERKELFLKNVVAQLNAVRKERVKRGLPPLTMQLAGFACRDMAKWFVSACKKEADWRVTSEIEKSRQKAEEQKMKDLDETVSGNPSGDYAEIVMTEDQLNDSKV